MEEKISRLPASAFTGRPTSVIGSLVMIVTDEDDSEIIVDGDTPEVLEAVVGELLEQGVKGMVRIVSDRGTYSVEEYTEIVGIRNSNVSIDQNSEGFNHLLDNSPTFRGAYVEYITKKIRRADEKQ